MKVAVLGLGLIGGSIGLAARAGGARVVGFDPDPRTREQALAAGAVDEAVQQPEQALASANVVFAAAPVGALAQTVSLALREAPSDCVISDVGSTKRALLAELREQPGVERFIGGHPLAGSHLGGIEHARADLFQGSSWCLMPSAQTRLGDRLRALIAGFGATPVEMDAQTHDRLMARISHLPHVLANVLVAGVADCGERERALAGTGPSFRDATRVAGVSSAIWTDIYLSNADMLIEAIDEAIGELTQVRTRLSHHDAAALDAWSDLARARRRSLLP
ncbi:MAG TPA: prephenate dehydrogenase/arogenate dehydrogenase family protein [Solirubrobacteraceae bacterium]|nr:prephenate dehydrogenase/arogenate dehydrogenase family protein [Solirubrobacteraceae bacterium]